MDIQKLIQEAQAEIKLEQQIKELKAAQSRLEREQAEIERQIKLRQAKQLVQFETIEDLPFDVAGKVLQKMGYNAYLQDRGYERVTTYTKANFPTLTFTSGYQQGMGYAGWSIDPA